KANLETIESLKSKDFKLSESAVSKSENQHETDCHKIEKVCDKEENPKVIALGMFKLNVSHCVSSILMSKSSCDSKNVEIKLKRKRRKRKSSKQNVKQVDNDVSRANNDFVHFSDLDTFSSVRRPKNSDVIWKKKSSSNTYNIGLSAVSVSNLNKNVKRYSCKDLLACNNSHLGETSSAYMYNDAMNVSCDSRMNDLLDDNNFFIFDDVNVRISPVSKMPFRKKPRDSMHVRSKSTVIKFLPRTVHKWLPKLQMLAEPVAKWFPRIVQICLWIIDSGCSKYMTGNRALLTNFVEKFLGTVRFGNNDFAVIAGYGDVVIGSMTIKKVCYVEGLVHNLFSVGQFCDKGLEVAFRKSTCFVRNEDGVDFLTGDRSSNFYTVALNEVASNSSSCLLAKAFPLIYNKRTRKIRESVNVNFDEISEMASKQFSLEPGLSNLNETGKSSNRSVSQVGEASKKDLEDLFQDSYDEFFDSSMIMKSLTTNIQSSNVEVPSPEEEVFHEISDSFQGKSFSSSLNDDVQQSPEEDAYFDASTSFHDPSNVHTYYQPYPHEKKWNKDNPLHKIIVDPKSSVRTRGQLANSCLFSCLLSSIEPANVAEALRDADWVSAMQKELNQFARLKVWRLVPRLEGKSVIKPKWIFKNKKDKSSLVI
nr:retrovirus-related Pol polyprotein from transposon TNT 1-94 [Tanacetum cinerariifolium]